MKTLSLYIDRWYISAAVTCDNVPRRIDLPNREERIWLYFYEDVNNDRIVYGKNYQQHFLDKEVHYYGDVFSKIVKDDETFKRFGKDVSIKEIFKASEIFDHLRKDFAADEEVTTYVSFSIDVTYAAQKVFLDILEANNFKVKESVARISHLAVELSNRKGKLNDACCILVITACNENLRYIVYKRTNEVFVRLANEGLLAGHGTDLRGRALLEQIVWQINSSSKFLKEEEVEYEITRLSQNLERRLLQLDNTKLGRPVVYDDITFSRALHNKQSATIIKSIIEERTKAVVNTVVDNIVRYVKDSNVVSSDISHILFIGDSFKNAMFKEALLQRYAVESSSIMFYQDQELPEIVSVYNQIDLAQFDGLRKNVENLSSEQLNQIRLDEEERREREKATRKQEEIEQANAAVRDAEKRFNAAMHDAENYEKRGDYNGMIDLLKIALTLKPDNSEAKQLLEEANRKLSELKVKNEQYNRAIRLAQDAFSEQRWQDAYVKSEAALELRLDSSEAKRIYTESQRRIKLAESVKEFLLRADTFIGQKLYQEAIDELNKAKHADANNKEISQRIEKIEAIQNERKSEIENLLQQISKAKSNNDFEKAIEICNELLDKDSTNQRKWSEYIITLKAEWNKQRQDAELFEKLKVQIDEASFNEEWKTLIKLCKEALVIKQDEPIKRFLQKAEAKSQIIIEQQEFEQNVAHIKSLIADKYWDEADIKTKELQKKYPEHNDIAKQLFRQIFEAKEAWTNKTEKVETVDKPTPPKRVVGFKQEPDNSFFEQNTPGTQKKPAAQSQPQPKKKDIDVKPIAPKPNKDDFFDLNIDQTQSGKKNSSDGVITNKDFDF